MKIKFLNKLLLILSFVLISIALKAQNFIPTVFAKTPNSTAFAKYGDYPVNLYSGLPDISIPLYNIEAGSLSIPITLSYHASGLKVNEPASWVGAGWSLNSGGGGITRNTLGRGDDIGGAYLTTFRDASTLNPTAVNDDVAYLYDVVVNPDNNPYDTRPDIYSYDLPGQSGKFFFNVKDSYKIETIPYAPLSIKTASSSGAMYFNILDEHGTSYQLGYNARELTNTATTGGGGQSSSNITAWKLENMISQNRRDTINFSYVSQGVTTSDKGQLITVEDLQQTNTTLYPGCPVSYANFTPAVSESDTDSGMNEEDPASITYKNGKITFTLDSLARTDLSSKGLRNIKVYTYNFSQKAYELQKTIVFYKSYYNTITPGLPGRLRLDSIQVLDKANSVIQRYRFVYNSQAVAPYHSFSKDYWGYYNGKMDGVSNPTLIPKTAVTFQQTPTSTISTIYVGSSDTTTRNPDSVYMQAGVLKTIYYPTGGHTTFAYQTNRYYDSHGTMHLAGGLRIDSISSYDNISATPVIKTYQYNSSASNFITSGFTGLINYVNYGFFVHNLSARYFLKTPGDGYVACVQKRVRSYYAESALNLTPTEGNPVAYTNVTEYTGTPGTNTGKSIYVFRYTGDDLSGTTGSTGVPVALDHFYARGQLLTKSDYLRKADGSYQIVKQINNTYTAFPDTLYRDVGMVVGQSKQTDGDANIIYPGEASSGDTDANAFPFTDYSIASDDNYLVSTTTQIYDINDPTKYTTSSTVYNYGDIVHQQIASTTHTDSRGNIRTSINKYAFNYPAGNAIIDSMVNRHMYADVIEKSEKYTIGTTTTTTAAQLNQFKNGYIPYSIVPSTVSILNIATPVSDFTPSTVTSGSLTSDSRYTQMISFDAYDSQNNIAQYTPRSSTPVSILWDYLHENPVAQVKNTTNNTFAYTSFEADGTGNFSYSGPTVTDPTAPTGSRVYVLGGGTITSSAFNTAKAYILSVWSNNGAPTVTAGSSSPTGTALRTNGNWTYYEYQLPQGTSSVIISGATTIDDLRLYPADAQMSTYAYDPNGITAMADTKGSINHFEYDPFQRLKNIKDWNGNIVKNYGYHTYDMTVPNDAIAATIFTRNNCPAGTTPGSTTYSVPANKYYSLTKASANAEAQYDLSTNGQIKANTICSCPIHYLSVTLSNSTGHPGYQATFSGIATPYNFPTTGSLVISVPEGTYATVSINPVGTFSQTFTMGTRTPVVGHYASFSSVIIATGSSDLSISIQ